MKRKLVQIGRSLAVTLPDEVVKEFKLEKGQSVEVSVDPLTGAATIRPGFEGFDDGEVTERFRRAVRALAKERAELYERLAE